jgi:hypothetical protein
LPPELLGKLVELAAWDCFQDSLLMNTQRKRIAHGQPMGIAIYRQRVQA